MSFSIQVISTISKATHTFLYHELKEVIVDSIEKNKTINFSKPDDKKEGYNEEDEEDDYAEEDDDPYIEVSVGKN